MELLCGVCSQTKGLSLEERMKLAKSRETNVVYVCPDCGEEHSYRGIGGSGAAPVEPTIEVEEEPIKNKDKDQNSDQLTLF
ncbi:hypothetical protein BEP19_02750 [Ammoniphilus oxalaticus]|uniref:Uncharacterized protein n=1 Tax=Ammoniphilus oxalaticus TaxID=66863 RepID=A0A419SNJ9_9BACL|nr:hypothetical protein [Ammoniphilus oxalaticus]RKD25868.1 hypothetical protein BEP19_02750 [Ammoniphilus oxalaticus]